MPPAEIEDSLFQAIATLIHEQRQAANRERRDIERHPYQCLQLVAPYDGEQLPHQHEFRSVLCHDLSPRGFSFFSRCEPESRQLIVALGRVPFKFLVAEIVRCCPRNPGLPVEFQIGCRFVRRIGEA